MKEFNRLQLIWAAWDILSLSTEEHLNNKNGNKIITTESWVFFMVGLKFTQDSEQC